MGANHGWTLTPIMSKDFSWLAGVFEASGTIEYTKTGLPRVVIKSVPESVAVELVNLYGGTLRRHPNKVKYTWRCPKDVEETRFILMWMTLWLRSERNLSLVREAIERLETMNEQAKAVHDLDR